MKTYNTLLRKLSKNPRLTLRRCYVDSFFRAVFDNDIKPASKVLDLGGVKKGDLPGAFNIADYDVQVTTLNIQTSANPDVIAAGEMLPFAENQFDVIVCSEVLEHVENPKAILEEANRVLGQGGTLLMTVPFLYHIHGCPEDYGRYTDYYWRGAMEKTGFEIKTLKFQGFWLAVIADFLRLPIAQKATGTSSRIIKYMMYALMVGPIALLRVLAVSKNIENEDKDPDSMFKKYTLGFAIIAEKQS